jgi:hypothetical protein
MAYSPNVYGIVLCFYIILYLARSFSQKNCKAAGRGRVEPEHMLCLLRELNRFEMVIHLSLQSLSPFEHVY